MILRQLELGPMANFIYLVGDSETKACAVIDPGWGVNEIIRTAEKEELTISAILLTHTHFDHATGAKSLSKKTSAKLYVHHLESLGSDNATSIDDGDVIHVGNLDIKCLHTPGHTPGSICFVLDDMIFTGDTLFVDAIGRTDLEGSDPEAMFKSLTRLASLPDKMIVYPGHDYGSEKTSTIGEQKKRNPYMKPRSMGDFLRM